MYFDAGCLLLMLPIVCMGIGGSPVEKSQDGRDTIVKVYEKLRKPLKDIMLLTRTIATNFAKEKHLANVERHESFWESCESHIGKNELKSAKDRQKRLVYAMKIYQELVKQLQITQIKESAINNGRYTIFTHEFRGLEFKVRCFVETGLRDAVKSIFGEEGKKKVPAYSTGVSHEIKVKETNTANFNMQNLQILDAVMFCSKNFLHNDIVQVAGKDRFMEEKTIGKLSRMPAKFTTELSGFSANPDLDMQDERSKTKSESTEKDTGLKLERDEVDKKRFATSNIKSDEVKDSPKQDVLDQLKHRLLDVKNLKMDSNWDLL